MIADIFLTVCVVIGVVSAILLAVLFAVTVIFLILFCISAVYDIGWNVKKRHKERKQTANMQKHTEKCE